MKPAPTRPRNQSHAVVRDAFLRAHSAGRNDEALAAALRSARLAPRQPQHWTDAATACVYLGRWSAAIDHCETALQCGGASFVLFDALSHAHGALGHADAVRKYGHKALTVRDSLFGQAGKAPPLPPEGRPLPPPGPATRARNLISFSLFGGRSRYCETAVLNALEGERLYPGWTCRFHVDATVPQPVLQRLLAAGAEVVTVEAAVRRWPGPMWRLLAADAPDAHRVIFRDADSVVSEREGGAVEEWVASGRRFHLLRDACTHTELILAGLWGLVAGSMPPLLPRVTEYLRHASVSPRFADQWFLRTAVWPYARQSLMAHDSQFGFMDARPFADGAPASGFHVGKDEGGATFATASRWPDGTAVDWTLSFLEGSGAATRKQFVCCYRAVVRDGQVKDHVPSRYLQRLRQGRALIELQPAADPTAGPSG